MSGDPVFGKEPFSTTKPEKVRMGNDIAFDTPCGVGKGYEVRPAGGQHGLTNPTPPKKGGPPFPGF